MSSGNFDKTFKPLSDLSGTVVTYIIEGKDPQNQKQAIKVLADRLKQNHGINHVTSINVADYLSPWTLSPCCGFQTPLTTSPPWSTVTPVVDPGTPDVTIKGISTSYTGLTVPRNESPDELIELKLFNTPPFKSVIFVKKRRVEGFSGETNVQIDFGYRHLHGQDLCSMVNISRVPITYLPWPLTHVFTVI